MKSFDWKKGYIFQVKDSFVKFISFFPYRIDSLASFVDCFLINVLYWVINISLLFVLMKFFVWCFRTSLPTPSFYPCSITFVIIALSFSFWKFLFLLFSHDGILYFLKMLILFFFFLEFPRNLLLGFNNRGD